MPFDSPHQQKHPSIHESMPSLSHILFIPPPGQSAQAPSSQSYDHLSCPTPARPLHHQTMTTRLPNPFPPSPPHKITCPTLCQVLCFCRARAGSGGQRRGGKRENQVINHHQPPKPTETKLTCLCGQQQQQQHNHNHNHNNNQTLSKREKSKPENGVSERSAKKQQQQ